MKAYLLICAALCTFMTFTGLSQSVLNVTKLGTDSCSTSSKEYGKLIFNSYLPDLIFESESGNIKEQEVLTEANPMGDEKFTYHVVLAIANSQKIIIKDQNSPDFNLTVENLEAGTCQSFYIDYGLQPVIASGTTATTGTLSLITNPPGAAISISGMPKIAWITPFTFNDVPSGSMKIKLEKSDYVPIDTTVTISPGKISEINVSLKSKKMIAQGDTKTMLESQIKKHGRKQSFWLVSTILSAGAGGYFMYEANQLYKEYQASDDSHATELRETVELYDKLAPACFGLAAFCAIEYTIQTVKKGKDKKQLSLFMSGQGAKLTYTF